MEKRFQVFVSSTYEDLPEERREVMNALLELDAIPSGMELFPAADEDQWSLIKHVIDDCDYYIVIIGGRYGSTGSDGVSYTEKEYRYALEQKKPILAFLHRDPESLPAKRTEKTAEGRRKLEEFRDLAQQKMCKYWMTSAELGSVVSRSLVRLMKTNPGVGWVRGDALPDKDASIEILDLRTKVEALEAELEAVTTQAPEDAAQFSQGTEQHQVKYSFASFDPRTYQRQGWTASVSLTWNEMFSAISPLLIDEAPEYEIRESLNALVRTQEIDRLRKGDQLKGLTLSDFEVEQDAFQTIKIQLRALGLIAKSVRKRSVKDSATYWSLTPFGDAQMVKLRAIRRKPPAPVRRKATGAATRSKKKSASSSDS